MLLVVAAIIESNGKLLVCQRRCDSAFPLKWEFPGGKVKPGESAEEALARELQEELGVAARIGDKIYRTRHRYSEMAEELELTFFSATLENTAIRNLAFEQILWREPSQLVRLDFLAADRDLIEKFASGALRLPHPPLAQ
jgi:8-oxo-dGTP diphosphatase